MKGQNLTRDSVRHHDHVVLKRVLKHEISLTRIFSWHELCSHEYKQGANKNYYFRHIHP